MRGWWLLLALAGCDSQSEDGAQPAGLPRATPSAGQVLPAAGADAAQLEQRARTSLGAILRDPDSMRFAELRAGAANAVCGAVEARQPDGKRGVRPFVVTPEGVAVVSPTAELNLEDPEDPFPDFYIRWCASPAELARLQPKMIGGETLGLGAPPPDIPDVPTDLPLMAPPPEPVAEQPVAKAGPPPRPPAPTGDDSFFNAVARPAGKDGR